MRITGAEKQPEAWKKGDRRAQQGPGQNLGAQPGGAAGGLPGSFHLSEHINVIGAARDIGRNGRRNAGNARWADCFCS